MKMLSAKIIPTCRIPGDCQAGQERRRRNLFLGRIGLSGGYGSWQDWGVRGQTPVVERPGQRQSISAASAINAQGAFWFCTYAGALNAELFVC
jgi:hypothetical protein